MTEPVKSRLGKPQPLQQQVVRSQRVPLREPCPFPSREQPIGLPALTVGELLPPKEHAAQLERKRHQPVFAAFPAHLQQQVVEIDIAAPQAERFINADARVGERAGERIRPPLRGALGF